MANRCYQTIKLFGKPELVKKVIDFVILRKCHEFEDGKFVSDQFPLSLCYIKNDCEICLETKYGPADFNEISKFFPKVGFQSGSFTDGTGIDECAYMINGSVLYSDYLEVQGPEMWEDITGTKMNLKGVA
jgi:hypothetical protein